MTELTHTMHWMAPHASVIISIHSALLSAMFNPLHSSVNYSCSKSSFVILVITVRMISIMKGSHHMPTTKLTLFAASKDEWDTKQDVGKSMRNALYALRYAKRHLTG